MSKYDSMKFWRQTIARSFKVCQICNKLIDAGETYYCERLTDLKINFIGKKICSNCYTNLNKRAKNKHAYSTRKNN
jgi:hypothetical protein